jgi:hypothetical protein
MRSNKKLMSPDEPWCVPESPDRTRRWCFPETPPRLPRADQDEPWCFGDDPARDTGKRRRSRSWPV